MTEFQQQCHQARIRFLSGLAKLAAERIFELNHEYFSRPEAAEDSRAPRSVPAGHAWSAGIPDKDRYTPNRTARPSECLNSHREKFNTYIKL